MSSLAPWIDLRLINILRILTCGSVIYSSWLSASFISPFNSAIYFSASCVGIAPGFFLRLSSIEFPKPSINFCASLTTFVVDIDVRMFDVPVPGVISSAAFCCCGLPAISSLRRFFIVKSRVERYSNV